MPTALQTAQATEAFLRGEDPGPEYRDKYNHNNIVGHTPGGSQNIPLLMARNAMAYHFKRGQHALVLDILDAWENYADLDFMTTEVFSCNIYSAWIWRSILMAAVFADEYGDEGPADRLYRHTDTAAALIALSSGWVPNSEGFNGYPCVMTGARSWNKPARYMVSASSFGSAFLAEYLRANGMSSLFKELQKQVGTWSVPQETAALERIVRNVGTESDFAEAQAVLDRGPRPKVSATILRTDESVFWASYNTINTGSTCWLPGKGWTVGHNPWTAHPYSPDSTSFWLSVDRPRRKWGVKGEGVFYQTGDGLWQYKAQRVGQRADKDIPKNSWWNELTSKDVTGWRICTIPGKEKVRVEIGPTGYSIILDGGTIEPPPPEKIDMLELMAPSSVDFAKTGSVGGRISTVRDDAGRVFTVVKGRDGMAWDWFYWDDEYIYHFLTNEPGGWDNPESFKTHVAPGVIWCKRFAELGESHVSSPKIHKWDNCVQAPAISMQEASTTLHERSYTAGQLGMASADVPGSTVCYRIDWRWGPNITNLETFTYAVGWGFLDWDRKGADSKPVNLRTPEPLVQPVFPCFNVPDWVDEHMRDDDPPPSTGWHTIKTSPAYLKFSDAMAEAALEAINSGDNHFPVSQVALETNELAQVWAELRAITEGGDAG